MNERKNLVSLINHIANNDFKKAQSSLAAVVNEKVAQRILAANQQLQKQGSK